MYQMTPFVEFCEGEARSARDAAARGEGATYLFAFAHEETDGPFEEPLKAGGAEAEDVARDDDREAAREGNDDLLGRAAGVVEIEGEETYAMSSE